MKGAFAHFPKILEFYETTPKEIQDTTKPASKHSFDTSKENYWTNNKTKTQENSAYKTAVELFLTFSLLSLSLPPPPALLHTQHSHTLRALRHLLFFPFLPQIFRSICFFFYAVSSHQTWLLSLLPLFLSHLLFAHSATTRFVSSLKLSLFHFFLVFLAVSLF